MSPTDSSTKSPTRQERARALLTRAGVMKKTVYASIARALRRRPAIPVGAQGFRYHAPVLAILWVFIVLSAVELVVIDLIVQRWLIARIICIVIGIWGLIWMIGLLCAYYMRPHTVGPEGIEIRNGLELNVRIGWENVYSVAFKKHSTEPKSPKIISDADQQLLVIGILNETNIEIVLEQPTRVTLPGIAPNGGEHTIDAVRLWADSPTTFLNEARNYL